MFSHLVDPRFCTGALFASDVYLNWIAVAASYVEVQAGRAFDKQERREEAARVTAAAAAAREAALASGPPASNDVQIIGPGPGGGGSSGSQLTAAEELARRASLKRARFNYSDADDATTQAALSPPGAAVAARPISAAARRVEAIDQASRQFLHFTDLEETVDQVAASTTSLLDGGFDLYAYWSNPSRRKRFFALQPIAIVALCGQLHSTDVERVSSVALTRSLQWQCRVLTVRFVRLESCRNSAVQQTSITCRWRKRCSPVGCF